MAQFAFKFISGKYQGGEFPIPDEGELLIGRSNELDLVLVEDMVSRKHAKLVAGDSLTITDLGSTNGTFVNGEKIRRSELKRNDRILIGTSILKVIDAVDMTINKDSDADEIKEMMEDLAARSSETSTMSGDLEEVPLPDLLQLFSTNKRNGILKVSGEHRGKLYIKDGQLQYCVISGEVAMKPIKALLRMIAWDQGAFVLDPYDDNVEFPDTFEDSTESILMECLRQLDEMQQLLSELPGLDAQLEMCIPMTPRLADLEESQLDTLQLVVNFGNLKSVIDKTEDTDYVAIKNVHGLLREGYLEVEA